jgi:dTDP-4-amino-4,6-dideoxygalactose transaminase
MRDVIRHDWRLVPGGRKLKEARIYRVCVGLSEMENERMRQAISFNDLGTQQSRIRGRLDAALARVLGHGQYIMGPEVAELEARLGAFCGARHAIACASGTDALALALMALDVRAGDAILVPAFTFAATAEVIPLLGAVPVFVDVHADSFNLDPASLEAGIRAAQRAGLRPVGIVAVDLFGHPADYDAIQEFAWAHQLWVVADAAQSFGASWRGRRVGTLAQVTATSFFPTKPLGCYGDGGAVFTDDADLAAVVRSLRVHGQGEDKYDNVRIGLNARLDTIQAAVLLAKLEIFADEIEARRCAAERYEDLLAGAVVAPSVCDGALSTWAQYTIRLLERDELRARLATAGVPTAVYYPRPLHRQSAYRDFPVAEGGCPIAERVATEVLSLPMHAYLGAATQERIAANVHACAAPLRALRRRASCDNSKLSCSLIQSASVNQGG